jgi:spermidine synthase
MSNTFDEIRDFYFFLNRAYGSVLINGLGLGVTVKFLLDKPEVTKIIVIEKSKDVISLVAPYFNDKRLCIINADAFEYNYQGEKLNFVWHDIWDDIVSENLPEMTTLCRKYGRKTENQACWCRARCERYDKQEKKEERMHNRFYK